MIQKDIDAPERETIVAPGREKIDGIRKYDILNILKNVGSIFTGLYFHCKDVPKETMFERSIEERKGFKKGRFDEIKRKEQNINNELFKAYCTDY